MHRFNLGNPTDETDTSRLTAAAARGDIAAFDALYSLTSANLFGLGYLITFDESTAGQAVAQAYKNLLGLFESDGLNKVIDEELLEQTQLAASALAGEAAEMAPVPTSPTDELAVAAIARLTAEQRSALWLVEVLHQPMGAAATILGRDEKSMRETVRQARNNFRSYYAKAHSAGLLAPSHECASAQNLLVAYAGRNLNAGHTVAVEQHLGRCDDCRNTVARLDDLEGRIRQVLPPVPAWLAQLAAEAVPMTITKPVEKGPVIAPFAGDKVHASEKKASRRRLKEDRQKEKAARQADAAAARAEQEKLRPAKPTKRSKRVAEPKPFVTAEPSVRVADRTPRQSLLDWKAFGVAAGVTAILGIGFVAANSLFSSEPNAPLLARSELPTTIPTSAPDSAAPTTEAVATPQPTTAPAEEEGSVTTQASAAPGPSTPAAATPATRAPEPAAPRAATAPATRAPAPAPAPAPTTPPAPTIVPSYELRRGVLPPSTRPPAPPPATSTTTTPPAETTPASEGGTQ